MVVVLEEKILGLEEKVELLLRRRGAEEFLGIQAKESPLFLVQRRKELKNLEKEEFREET